jgi:serine-type D-Ala-D-Ala carboxypeptidase (penicillin-binding protein 5/6)
MMAAMSRLFCARSIALIFTAVFITSCGGNPPPPLLLSSNQQAPQQQQQQQLQAPEPQATRIAAIPQSPPPPIAAESAIVIDAVTGRVLYAKNADAPRAVASTQKIVTALCILDAGNIDQTVNIAANDGDCEPTKLGLKSGESYTRRELLKVLIVKSANDVARCLARDVGGNQENFAALMNQKAAALGMRNSHFCNPHGLTVPEQHSTARDMAIAARAIYRSPLIRSYAATKSFTFTFNDGHTRFIENTNKVLKTLPYCDGLKTGTTDVAGRCLIASGSLNGRSIIAVVLKSTTPNIWNDATKLLRWSLERPASGS